MNVVVAVAALLTVLEKLEKDLPGVKAVPTGNTDSKLLDHPMSLLTSNNVLNFF